MTKPKRGRPPLDVPHVTRTLWLPAWVSDILTPAEMRACLERRAKAKRKK